MSQVFVKRRLKAPATAEFPSWLDVNDFVTDLGGGHFFVSAYVDSLRSLRSFSTM